MLKGQMVDFFLRQNHACFMGFSWDFAGSNGYVYWNLMELHWNVWNLLGFHGIYSTWNMFSLCKFMLLPWGHHAFDWTSDFWG